MGYIVSILLSTLPSILFSLRPPPLRPLCRFLRQRSRVGRGVWADGLLLCHGGGGQDGVSVEYGLRAALEDFCRAPEGGAMCSVRFFLFYVISLNFFRSDNPNIERDVMYWYKQQG